TNSARIVELLEKMDRRIDAIDDRVHRVVNVVSNMDQANERRFAHIDERFSQMEHRLSSLEAKYGSPAPQQPLPPPPVMLNAVHPVGSSQGWTHEDVATLDRCLEKSTPDPFLRARHRAWALRFPGLVEYPLQMDREIGDGKTYLTRQ